MPPKVSDRYKEQKRASLLKSAFDCFAEKGFHQTTIDDIAAHAKSSKGAIYNYFSSKEEIFLQILESRNRESIERIRTAFADLPSSAEKLRFLLDKNRRIPVLPEAKSWGVLQMEFLLNASRHERIQQAVELQYERFMLFYKEIMEEGRANGEFRADLDTHVAASLFWKLTNGIALHFALMTNDQVYDPVLEGAEEMLFGYLCDGKGSGQR